MPSSTPAPAASILLLRPLPDGLRVLLLQRHLRSGFMPRLWVFPGGRVEPQDRIPDDRIGLSTGEDPAFAWPPDDVIAARRAGIRETFEESGVWLGTGTLPEAARRPLHAGETDLPTLLQDHDARLDLAVVRPWARWITPPSEGRRFDALFFVAEVPPEDDTGRHDARETIDSAWLRPAEALADPDIPLAPPTWCLLDELARLGDLEAVRAALPRRDLRPVMPVPVLDDGALVMHLPGSDRHPDAAREGHPWALRRTAEGWTPSR